MTGIRTVYEYSYEDRVSPRHFRGFKSEGVVLHKLKPKLKFRRWFNRNNNDKTGCSDPPVNTTRRHRRYRNNNNKKHLEKKQQRWQPPRLVIDKTIIVEEEDNRIGNYVLDKLLGEGGWGSVYLATTFTYEHDDDDDVAIKVLPRYPKKGEDVVDMAYYQRSIALEASILQNHGSQHTNIIGYHETLCTPQNVYLVMEKATVNLATMIYNMDYVYDQSDFRQQVMTGILRGIQFLHSKGIAHCDIKPENIVLVASPHALIQEEEQQQGDDDDDSCCYRFQEGGRIEACDVRLIDFGIAHTSENYCGGDEADEEAEAEEEDATNKKTTRGRSRHRRRRRPFLRRLMKRSSSSGLVDESSWDTKHDIPMTHGAGTTHWKAPETNQYGYEARRADIWSCGAILVRLVMLLKRDTDWCCQTLLSKDCFGEPNACWTLVSQKLKRAGIDPNDEIPLLYDFLSNYLLPFNPQQRATAQKALQHSWLQLQPKPCMENRQVDKAMELRAALHQQQ